MNPNTIPKIVKNLYRKYPKFPDGRIDYSDKKTCAVLTIFVEFNGKILLMQRSDKVSTYKGKWMTLAGYYDELVPIKKKILEELREELNIGESNVKTLTVNKPHKVTDRDINKEWIIFTSRIILGKSSKIKLDWEHTEYKWVKPQEILNMNIVPSLIVSLRIVYKD
ncbi:TPA: NUDIX domain-containing protein [Candidatus Woesearchaeota archaeon]|nr:NUDIX domain-containing protein [Candidatus Woesearchaeota archaeon]HIH31690.1 NUDIX domain-containing protein [Candidatus Woesearchaeota archaeon]HIH54953.1 NUDIX domain-containing protein [Candidatus Woesearchaeota archaeon]HIJ02646.1 NUDIX domain-containing protein [Candidatus Woesearchaeota archaeon]HIJ13616.1 NUDIX domain-containing protein [Candidatus Woesearchaeota archaeon]